MTNLASGTVTLLFTDIEGSTRLLRELGDGYEQVLGDQRRLLREAFAARNGSEVDTAGDGFFYAFPRARDALLAAVEGQRALGAHEWPGVVQVRMGMHTGEPLSSGTGFVGLDVHRAARIMGAAHGGQILISQTTHDLARDLPPEIGVLDLGEHTLKDLPAAEHLFQVTRPDLVREFPPLRSLDASQQPAASAHHLRRQGARDRGGETDPRLGAIADPHRPGRRGEDTPRHRDRRGAGRRI